MSFGKRRYWFNGLVVIALVMGLVGFALPLQAAAPNPQFEELANYITTRLADWSPTISADQLYENLSDGDETNDPFIVSVRKPEAYAKGHIAGAYNIFYKDLTSPANLRALPTDRQIVVYCYTGHTGQVGATLLRLMGYDAVNLKYGMMGWTDDDEVLGTTRYEGAAGYPTETEPHQLTGTFDPPSWTVEASATMTATTAVESPLSGMAELVRQRAAAVLPNWAPTLAADALYENLNDGDTSNDPVVVSVRQATHYALGHVPGAYNIPWKEIAKPENLAKLPPDKPIVAYCYTGHTGQVASTVLAVLGYGVTNMKFGMMGWTDDDTILATERYSGAAGYPVETTPHPLPTS